LSKFIEFIVEELSGFLFMSWCFNGKIDGNIALLLNCWRDMAYGLWLLATKDNYSKSQISNPNFFLIV